MTRYSVRKRLPSLNALRAFEAAARHHSFKDAADELSVSQSAISHQIKALEAHLSTQLFVRKTRAIELTAKGKLYYPILRDAFERIAEGTRLIQDTSESTNLTLHVYSTFTIRWLLPRLSRFQEKNPDIQVRLHTSQDDVNFSQEDIDAAIMIGQPDNDSLAYNHLFDCELFPVASPDYVQKHGIEHPSDLAEQPLLQVYPSAADWFVWLAARDIPVSDSSNWLQFESYDVALSSAVQGMGIALGQQPYIRNDLDAGILVELFPEERVPNPNHWYLVCRKERNDLPKLKLFRDWLREETTADESLPGRFHFRSEG